MKSFDNFSKEQLIKKIEVLEYQINTTSDSVQHSSLFKALVTNTEEIVYIIDIDGIFTLSEGKGLSKLGLKSGEVVGQSVFELYKEFPDMLDKMRRTLQGETITSEVCVAGIHFRNWYTPYLNEKSEIIGLLGLSVDITDQKRAENQIIAEKEFTETALNSQIDTFFLFEAETGKAIRWNSAFRKITGYTDKEITSLHAVTSYYSKDEAKKASKFIDGIYKGGTDVIELDLICKDGSVVPTEYRVSKLDDKDNSSGLLISIGRNISQRRIIDKKIKKSTQLLNKVADIAKIGGWEMDLKNNGKAIWTKGTYDIVELPLDSPVPGLYEHTNFYLPKYHDLIKSKIETLIKTKEPMEFEAELRTVNGNIKYCRAIGEVVEKHSEVVKIQGTFQDISHQKKTEERVKLFSRIYEETLNEIYLFNTQSWRFYQVNNAAIENLGYSYKEIMELTPLDLKPRFNKEDFTNLVAPLVEGKKKKVVFETVHERKNGSLYDVEVHLQLVEFEDKELFAAFIIDITERNKVLEQRKELDQKLHDLILNIDAGIIIHDSDTSVILSNPKAEELLGLSKNEIIGRQVFDPYLKFVDVNNVSLKTEDFPVNKIIENKKTIKSEVYGVQTNKNGNLVWLLLSGFPVFTKKGRISEIIISFIDISKHIESERKLINQHEHLEDLIRERTKELEEKNKELDNALKVFVGREITIQNLQKSLQEKEKKH